jgi:hypothetical protein
VSRVRHKVCENEHVVAPDKRYRLIKVLKLRGGSVFEGLGQAKRDHGALDRDDRCDHLKVALRKENDAHRKDRPSIAENQDKEDSERFPR